MIRASSPIRGPGQPQILYRTKRGEFEDRFQGQATSTGLRTHLTILLEDDDLTSTLRKYLRRTEASRTRADYYCIYRISHHSPPRHTTHQQELAKYDSPPRNPRARSCLGVQRRRDQDPRPRH